MSKEDITSAQNCLQKNVASYGYKEKLKIWGLCQTSKFLSFSQKNNKHLKNKCKQVKKKCIKKANVDIN